MQLLEQQCVRDSCMENALLLCALPDSTPGMAGGQAEHALADIAVGGQHADGPARGVSMGGQHSTRRLDLVQRPRVGDPSLHNLLRHTVASGYARESLRRWASRSVLLIMQLDG